MDRRQFVEELLESSHRLRRKTFSHVHTGNITTSQWLVVAHLFHDPNSTVNDTARALKMTGSAVTQLVNGLVKSGYIKRAADPEDRRAIRLTLSAESRKKIQEFKKKRIDMMLKMFEALTDSEFEHYVALNKKILSSLK